MKPLRSAIAFAGCCLSGVVIWRGVDFSTSPEVVPVVPVVLTERGSWQGGTWSSGSQQDGGARPGESQGQEYPGQSPPSTQQRWAVVTRQAANLAKSDPDAAERWALSLAEGEREVALATLATELAGFDFEAAGRVAMKMQDTPERNATLSFVSAQWASEDPAAAIEWVRTLPGGPLRAAIERRVVPAVADQDPSFAAQYVRAEMPDDDTRRAVIPEIIQRWAQSDASSALAWAAAFPDTDVRQRNLEALFRVWIHQDPSGPGTWLATQGGGSLRDEAARILSSILASTDRAAALSLARAIGDATLRATTMDEVARHW